MKREPIDVAMSKRFDAKLLALFADTSDADQREGLYLTDNRIRRAAQRLAGKGYLECWREKGPWGKGHKARITASGRAAVSQTA
jgi:hypothetical protein